MEARCRCVPRLLGMDADRDAIDVGGKSRISMDSVFVGVRWVLESRGLGVPLIARQESREAFRRCVSRLLGTDAESDAITICRRSRDNRWAGLVCSGRRACRRGAVAVVWFVSVPLACRSVRVVFGRPASVGGTHCRSLRGWCLLVRLGFCTRNIPKIFSGFADFRGVHRSFAAVQFGGFPRGGWRLARVSRCVR